MQTRLDRGRAVRLAVVAGDIDDRQPHPFIRETPAQLDARFSIQVDVEDEAKGLAKIFVAEQRTGRLEQF